MTDQQASDWEYKIICCLGISTSNSDINVVGLHKTVKELYEQGRADEREAQVCCGDYEKCMKACTPRGRWLAEKELTQPEQDWSLLKATQESLREHMAKVKELEAQLAQPEQEELIQFKDGKWSYVRKPWVGLTDEERNRYRNYTVENFYAGVLWAEAKLKEKNHGN